MTAPARSAFRESFNQRVRDEHPELPEEEVQRRGHALYKQHFAHMSLIRETKRAMAKGRKAAQK